MKLDTIFISRFRCFEEAQLAFEDDVTVLVGVNGAGKTAFLDALALSVTFLIDVLARRNSLKEVDLNALFRPTDLHSTSRSRANFVKIAASLSDLTPEGKESLGDVENGLLECRAFYSPHADPNSYPDYPGFHEMEFSYALGIWDSIDEEPEAEITLPLIAYYRSDRKLKGEIELGDVFKSAFNRESAYDHALDAAADYSAMCKWLYVAENQVLREPDNSQSPIASAYRSMNRALHLLVEDVKSFGFLGIPPSLIFEVGSNGTSRSQGLEQLSDGYRSLIGICLDFARRLALANPNSKKPLELPAILLIDEIELHLHASWQQTVIPKLREIFPNTQIICTTHSPQVLTSVEDRCIRILDGQNVHAAPSGTWGAESKRLLEDVLGVSSRPPERFAKPVKQLHELQDLIDQGKYEEAKAKIDEFISKGYEADPAIIDANLTVENRLWEEAHTG